MAYIKYAPYNDNVPYDTSTTSSKEIQLWQELTMLRHLSGANAIYAKGTIAPWIDQAKTYYLDACNASWKSAGLLYYYSFLNLAKAHLVTNRVISGRKLKSTSIYHGLTAQPQAPSSIINFQIEIHPPGNSTRRNIFSHFYQTLVRESWPFRSPVTVTLSNIISYCDDISHETHSFYNILKSNIRSLSLIRDHNNGAWLELLVPDIQIPQLQRDIGTDITSITPLRNLSPTDKIEWNTAYGLSNREMTSCSFIKIRQFSYSATNRDETYSQMTNHALALFKGYISPLPTIDLSLLPYWYFIPKITINNNLFKWHPLLSDYLFAFMLSTVLRYQPHLFNDNNQDSFIAEAWCNQSASTSLRYFLSALSKHNIRLN